MGLIRFQPAVKPDRGFEVRQLTPEAAATIAIGEPVQRNAGSPEFIEAHAGGATVTGILGVALAPATTGTPLFGSTIGVAMANTDTEFLGQIWDVSGGAVATAAVGTHEGVSFGYVEPTAGEWYVDEEDTTNVVLRVTRVIPQWNAVLFKFLASAIGS